MPHRPWSHFVPATGPDFTKMQGLGNHFVIVDGRARPYRPTVPEIARICDPRTGVGGDQLLIVEPPRTQGAHAFMRILNIDGAEVGACGNATRCFGWLMLEETGRDEITLETLAGLLRCRRIGDRQVSVEMGRITADWRAFPLSRAVDMRHIPVANGPLRDGIALHIGNPHVTYFVEDLAALDVATLAPPIQNDPLFPEGVNVGVAQVMTPGHLKLSVYERPGILTAACGSGACVAVFAARLRGAPIDPTVRVEMQAGSVDITIDDEGRATMVGPVDYCFSGRLSGQEGLSP